VKNITVTVSDELYHAARVKAAEQHTTVSAIVREQLKEFVTEPKESLEESLRALFEKYDRERAGKRFHVENNLCMIGIDSDSRCSFSTRTF
jgi:hypothetical protein